MDWNTNLRSFLPRPETSLDFLYTYNYDQYPGLEIKHTGMVEKPHPHGLIPEMDKNSYCSQEKKKRLTTDQLDSLERSFQEEIKLDPDRKMKLSRELGLQPRQIAVWFQNRRARWKVKKLEVLYDALKQEFDIVSEDKQRLQEEVMKLKSMLREQATRKQVSTTGYTDISGEETVESTSLAIGSSNKPRGAVVNHHQTTNAAECNYAFNVDVYNNNPAVSSPFWGVIPSYP